jgi:hypothetical protein
LRCCSLQEIGDTNVDEVKKELMVIAMEHTRNRIEAAASALHISHGKYKRRST